MPGSADYVRLAQVAAEPNRESTERRRTFAAAISLARARLSERGWARFARAVAALVFVGFAVAAFVLRGEQEQGASVALLVAEARVALWVIGLPIAVAAAGDLRAADRNDGVEALVAARGLSPRSLVAARFLAAMIHASLVLGLAVGGVALVSIAFAVDARAALARVSALVGSLFFAVVAGAVLGGLGSACGRAARKRGQRLVLALVVLPWLVGDAFGHAGFSIPGALDAVMSFALGVAPVGAA